MKDYFPKCFNCGYCCIYYDVIIIKPEFKDIVTLRLFTYGKDKKLNINIDDVLMHKPCNERCPHLNENNLCEIHDKIWFKKTPCYKHNLNKHYLTTCPIGENRHLWQK